jgi:thiol-disulfide isomerase/thioredoxin
MTKSSRASRREAARTQQKPSPNRYLLPLVGIGVVLVAAIAAIALTSGGGSTASTPVPSFSSVPIGSVAAPTVSGTPLPKFDKTAGDPAIGQTIPTVQGQDFAGQPVSIELNGKPKVLLFLAHWCVHCQAEVPVVEAWVKAKGMPEGIDLVAIATSNDPNAPNYPPDAWLAREGWTVPTIVDTNNSVATAYGLSAFPFFVFVGADGTVTGRMTGELPIADLETIISSLPR